MDQIWNNILIQSGTDEKFIEFLRWLDSAYNATTVFPDRKQIFRAFELTTFSDTKVVILGQDPYPTKGHPNGLSFSCDVNQKKPKSLINIHKELFTDLGIKDPKHGNLENWAKNGVLLLNTTLTVEEGKARSHTGKGWEIFTENVIKALDKKEKPVVFILWGKEAQKYKKLIKNGFIVESTHPSPMSAKKGFLGSKPFSFTNQFLTEIGSTPIDWTL